MEVRERRVEEEAAAALAAGVAGYALGVEQSDILDTGKRGANETAFARQVAMYLCHVAFELSLARVALAFGRDRSTVSHACHVIEDRRDDERFDAWIEALEAMLRGAPARVAIR
ncbi:MAG TPA: helix-turn-helix domain-containing protein [Caulobacterales bacterium]|nr:helix-turn-helix domain-containing protein [Caulobacterales bacterium]